METYSWMRQFADSWMLLAMTMFFLGVIVWAFRPGSSKTYKDTSQIPFRNETTCSNNCPDCACGAKDLFKIGGAQ